MMKFRLSLLVLAAASLMLSCEKESKPTPTVEVEETDIYGVSGVDAPEDADGAFYVIRNVLKADGYIDTLSDITTAWVGNHQETEDVGFVSCNTDTLEFINLSADSLFSVAWYTGILPYYLTDSMIWSMDGNANYDGFKFTDASGFPRVSAVNVLPVWTEGLDFEASFVVTECDVAIVSLYTNDGTLVKRSQVNAGSHTFKVDAEKIKTDNYFEPYLFLQIMPVKLKPYDFGDKRYYFVKQFAYEEHVEII